MSEFEKYARAIQEDIASLKTSINSVKTELKADITELRADLKTDIAELRTELKTDIALLPTKAEMNSAINLAKKEIFEEMDKYKYAKEIDHLRGRMNVVEDRLEIQREEVVVEE